MTPNLTITNGDFESNGEVLEKKIKKPLKVPSLPRFVPKPLKVPSRRQRGTSTDSSKLTVIVKVSESEIDAFLVL